MYITMFGTTEIVVKSLRSRISGIEDVSWFPFLLIVVISFSSKLVPVVSCLNLRVQPEVMAKMFSCRRHRRYKDGIDAIIHLRRIFTFSVFSSSEIIS